MRIEVLGSYGNRAKGKFSTCFRVNSSILIDAGNIIEGVKDLENIKHIFLTHSHIDHIVDIPFLIDNIFVYMKEPLNIYASPFTIKSLKKYLFNNHLWPSFQDINLINSDKKSINFIEIKEGEEVVVDNVKIVPFLVNHTIETFGYIIDDEVLISGDSAYFEGFVEVINKFRPNTIFMEVSFPSRMQDIANISKHMTPNDLKKLINKIEYSPTIYAYHLKPPFEKEIKEELKEIGIKFLYKFILDKEIKHKKDIEDFVFDMMKNLYFENDYLTILERVVTYARELTNADGATLYIKSEDDKFLEFKIVQNESLNIFLKGEISWPSLPLYKDGKENKEMVAVLSALSKKVINIEDVYHVKEFNFEGTKTFDKRNNYRSKSMLVVPLKNHEDEVIGVLQLINKKSGDSVIAFDEYDENIVLALASIAAVTLTKNRLIEDFQNLLESLIQTIGMGIDKKSKYTGGHVRRVAKLALMIAKALEKEGIKSYTKEEFRMIEIAGWLHDIGKIATPESVMDKATKLEKIVDRIEYIKYKFELKKALSYIEVLEGKKSKDEYIKEVKFLDENFEFIKELNKGAEFVSDEKIEKLRKIKEVKLNSEDLLSDDEFYNLSIRKGTLNDKELKIMREHAKIGLEMLLSLNFPKKYKRVPQIAANHHEKLNCKGYPRGLCEEELSIEERIMSVADIFEALSASDRPYKEPKKISEIFKILYFMAKDKEIDKEIVRILIKDVYLEYAKEELKEFQIDEIDKEVLEFFNL